MGIVKLSTAGILDPFNSSKNTTVRTFSGNVVRYVSLRSSLWMDTSSVTSIKLLPQAAFLTGSRLSLYGLKKGA